MQIREAFARDRGTCVGPRVHAELQESGIKIGLNRVAALMRTTGLCVQSRRGFRVCTTVRDSAREVAPDVLARGFTASAPNQKWVGDVTFIETGEGWLYLTTMIDLYNREIVGWAMSDRNDQGIICSMSRKVNCWDNSVAESCITTIKKDLIHRERFATRSNATPVLFEYVEGFYNRILRRSSLVYMTPVQFREHDTTAAEAT